MVNQVKAAIRFTFGCTLWLLMALLIITDQRFDVPGVMPRFVFWSITTLTIVFCIGSAILAGMSEELGAWIAYMVIPLYMLEGVVFSLLYKLSPSYKRLHRIFDERIVA